MRFFGYLVVSACLLSGILAEAESGNVPGPNKVSPDPLLPKQLRPTPRKSSARLRSGSVTNNVVEPKPTLDPSKSADAEPRPNSAFRRGSGDGGSGSIAASPSSPEYTADLSNAVKIAPVSEIVQPLWTYEKAEDFIEDFSLVSPEKQLDSVKCLFEIRDESRKLKKRIISKIKELKDDKDDKIVKLREYLNDLLNPSPRPTPYIPLTKPGEHKSAEKPGSLAGR